MSAVRGSVRDLRRITAATREGVAQDPSSYGLAALPEGGNDDVVHQQRVAAQNWAPTMPQGPSPKPHGASNAYSRGATTSTSEQCDPSHLDSRGNCSNSCGQRQLENTSLGSNASSSNVAYVVQLSPSRRQWLWHNSKRIIQLQRWLKRRLAYNKVKLARERRADDMKMEYYNSSAAIVQRCFRRYVARRSARM